MSNVFTQIPKLPFKIQAHRARIKKYKNNKKAPKGANFKNGGNDEACLARSRLTGLRLPPFMTLSYRRQASALSSLAPNFIFGFLASIIL